MASESLIENLVLVKLVVKYMTGNHKCAAVLDDAMKKYSVSDEAIGVTFKMFPKKWTRPLSRAISQLRQHWYDSTLPWDDSRWRVVTTRMFQQLVDDTAKLKTLVHQEANKITNNWDEFKKDCEIHAGKLWDEEAFPTKQQFLDSVSIDIASGTVASPADVRLVGLNEGAKKQITRAMQKRYDDNARRATNDLLDGLAHVVEAIKERTEQPEQKGLKYTKLIQRLTKLAQLARGLNLQDDPKIDKIAQDIEEQLTAFDPTLIKNGPIVRQGINSASADILKRIEKAHV